MDRLPALNLHPLSATLVTCALAGLAGCDDAKESPAAPPARVVAVQAARPTVSLESLCDVQPAERPVEFEAPPLAGAAPPALSSASWRWINVWATWCRPCIEEIPLLQQWTQRLRREGSDLQLVFLSADGSDDAVAAYRKKHPGLPPSGRFADPAVLKEWAAAAGLDDGAALPIHVFVDPDNAIRCARAGAVGADDFATVHALLTRG